MTPRSVRLLALACLVALAKSARADEGLDALLSESIESTASKSTGTSASAPALSLSISAETLRRQGIRTLAEAYDFLSMGLVSQDPLGEPDVGSRGVMFAGDNGKHVLLLLDGHTLNDQESGASFHGHGFGLPLELVDHIEVVLGPGSVLYGSNAMFGVINVITKRAKDLGGVSLVAEAAYSPPLDRAHDIVVPGAGPSYLKNLGQAYRVGATAGYEFQLGGRAGEVTTGVEYYTLDGPTMTWGPQPISGTSFGPHAAFGVWGGQTTQSYYEHTPSGYVRVIVGDVEAALHVVASRRSSPYLPRSEQVREGPDFDDANAYQDRRQLGLDLKWNHNLSRVVSLLTRVYADSVDQSSRFHEHGFLGCGPKTYSLCTKSNSGFARWLGTEVQSTIDWDARGLFSTLLGVDGRVRRVGYENSITKTSETKEIYGQVDRVEAAAAVYLQQIYQPATWFTLNAGARWDFDQGYGNRISPRAAAVISPWSGGTLKGIYSEALRAPTTDEQTFRDPELALQANQLVPESVRSAEAVLQQRFGAHALTFGVFRSWWSNMIIAREYQETLNADAAGTLIIRAAKRAGLLLASAGVVTQFQNVASIDNFGFNAGYDGSSMLGRLKYGVNLTEGYARIDTPEGKRLLSVTPSLFGNARVSYDLSNGLPTVGVAVHFSDERLSDAGQSAGFEQLPYAPGALELRATAIGPAPHVPKLSYRVMGDYSFARSNPYTAGPVRTGAQGNAPELIPVNRATILFGLQYAL